MQSDENASLFRLREVGREEWDLHWQCVERANLMQSWEYGDAKAFGGAWKPVRYLFEGADGEVIALAQIMVRSWPILGGVARLNRGPLLVSGKSQSEDLDTELRLLRSLVLEARKRRWWLFYLAPELNLEQVTVAPLEQISLSPRQDQGAWGSSLISLESDEAIMLTILKKRWRYLLRKAQKAELKLERFDGCSGDLERMVSLYQQMQQKKGFSGVPATLLKALANQKGPGWLFSLYVASEQNAEQEGNQWVGMLVSVVHGNTATYLIGYTDDMGRHLNANYLLLWQAILDAKQSGCLWFDLGGLNSNTPEGVAHFKRGLGGQEYQLVGEFRSKLWL